VLKSYKQTYELVKPSPELQKDFFDFFAISAKIKSHVLTICQYHNQSSLDEALEVYPSLFKKLSNLLAILFKRMKTGDSMKKQEAYFMLLDEGEFVQE
jgi:hypothetical protein